MPLLKRISRRRKSIKRSTRKSAKRKSAKRSTRKSAKRKSAKRSTRKSSKRKSSKRKSSKRKSSKRKSSKRKSSKRGRYIKTDGGEEDEDVVCSSYEYEGKGDEYKEVNCTGPDGKPGTCFGRFTPGIGTKSGRTNISGRAAEPIKLRNEGFTPLSRRRRFEEKRREAQSYEWMRK